MKRRDGNLSDNSRRMRSQERLAVVPDRIAESRDEVSLSERLQTALDLVDHEDGRRATGQLAREREKRELLRAQTRIRERNVETAAIGE
jgi:hypothetical protein